MGDSLFMAIWNAVTFMVRLIVHAVFGAYVGSASAIALGLLAVVIAVALFARRSHLTRSRNSPPLRPSGASAGKVANKASVP